MSKEISISDAKSAYEQATSPLDESKVDVERMANQGKTTVSFAKLNEKLTVIQKNWESEQAKQIDPKFFEKSKIDKSGKTKQRKSAEILSSWQGAMRNAAKSTRQIGDDLSNFRTHYKDEHWAKDLSRVGMVQRDDNLDDVRVIATGEMTDMFGNTHKVDEDEIDAGAQRHANELLTGHMRGYESRVKAGWSPDNIDGSKIEGGLWKRFSGNVSNLFRSIFGLEKKEALLDNLLTGYSNKFKEGNPDNSLSQPRFWQGFLRLLGIGNRYVAKKDLKDYSELLRNAAKDLTTGAPGSDFRVMAMEAGDKVREKKGVAFERADEGRQNEWIFRELVGQVDAKIQKDRAEKGDKSVFNNPHLKSLEDLSDHEHPHFLAEAVTTAMIAESFKEHNEQKAKVITYELGMIEKDLRQFGSTPIKDGDGNLKGFEDGKRSIPGLVAKISKEPETSRYMQGNDKYPPRPGMHAAEFFGKLHEEFVTNDKEIGYVEGRVNKLKEDGIFDKGLANHVIEHGINTYREINAENAYQADYYKKFFEKRIGVITDNQPGISQAKTLSDLRRPLQAYAQSLSKAQQDPALNLPARKIVKRDLFLPKQADPYLYATAEQFNKRLDSEFKFHIKVLPKVQELLDHAEANDIEHIDDFLHDYRNATPQQLADALKSQATRTRALADDAAKSINNLAEYNMGGGYNGPMHEALGLIATHADLSAKAWADVAELQQNNADRIESMKEGAMWSNEVAPADLSFDKAMSDLNADSQRLATGKAELAAQPFLERATIDLIDAGLEQGGVSRDDVIDLCVDKTLLKSLPLNERVTENGFLKPMVDYLTNSDRDVTDKRILALNANTESQTFHNAVDDAFVKANPLNREASSFALKIKLSSVGDNKKAEVLRKHYDTETEALLDQVRGSGNLANGLKQLQVEDAIPQENGKMLSWIRDSFFPRESGERTALEQVAARRLAVKAASSDDQDPTGQNFPEELAKQLQNDGFTGMTRERVQELLSDAIDDDVEATFEDWSQKNRDFALHLNDTDIGGSTSARASRLLDHMATQLADDGKVHSNTKDLENVLSSKLSDAVPAFFRANDMNGNEVLLKNPAREAYDFHQHELGRVRNKIDVQAKAQLELQSRMDKYHFDEKFLNPPDKDYQHARDGVDAIRRFLDFGDKIQKGKEMTMEIDGIFSTYETDLKGAQKAEVKKMHWIDTKSQTRQQAKNVGDLTFTDREGKPLAKQPSEKPTFAEVRSAGNVEFMNMILTETEQGRDVVDFVNQYTEFEAMKNVAEHLEESASMENNGLNALEQYHQALVNMYRGDSRTDMIRNAVRTATLDVFMQSKEEASTFRPADHRNQIEKRLEFYGLKPSDAQDQLNEIPEVIDNDLLAAWGNDLSIDPTDRQSVELMEEIRGAEDRILAKGAKMQDMVRKYHNSQQSPAFRQILQNANNELITQLLRVVDEPTQKDLMKTFEEHEKLFNSDEPNSSIVNQLSSRFAQYSASTGQGIRLLESFYDTVSDLDNIEFMQNSISDLYKSKPNLQGKIGRALDKAMAQTVKEFDPNDDASNLISQAHELSGAKGTEPQAAFDMMRQYAKKRPLSAVMSAFMDNVDTSFANRPPRPHKNKASIFLQVSAAPQTSSKASTTSSRRSSKRPQPGIRLSNRPGRPTIGRAIGSPRRSSRAPMNPSKTTSAQDNDRFVELGKKIEEIEDLNKPMRSISEDTDEDILNAEAADTDQEANPNNLENTISELERLRFQERINSNLEAAPMDDATKKSEPNDN